MPATTVADRGTNDAKANRWANWSSTFPGDYADMLASFQKMPSKPKVFVMVPPPLYRNGVYGMNQTGASKDTRLLTPCSRRCWLQLARVF